MGDALLQRLDLLLLLTQPPLQPVHHALAGAGEQGAPQSRPQSSLLPGEVVVSSLAISVPIKTSVLTIETRVVTILSIKTRLMTILTGVARLMTLLTRLVRLMTILTRLVRLMAILTGEARLMTISTRRPGWGSGEAALPVIAASEPHHGPLESLELVVICIPGNMTGARRAGFITPSLASVQ